MGKGKSAPAPQLTTIRPPSPQEIAAAQVEATRGILDLQLEKFPEFTAAEIERLRAVAPEAAEAVIQAQDIILQNVQQKFPQFFEVLQGLGEESLRRLSSLGELPPEVAAQAVEASRAEQATRGIAGSPIAVAGTAGQIAALAQAQRAQDLNLASGFLNLPFAPNLPLTGVPGVAGVTGFGATPGVIQNVPIPSFGEVTSAFGLQADVQFSNRALQLSNALLAQGGGARGGGFGSTAGAIAGGTAGFFLGGPVGAFLGGSLGGSVGSTLPF